jgi:hypothetical protein
LGSQGWPPVTPASKNSGLSLTMVVGEKPFSSAAE